MLSNQRVANYQKRMLNCVYKWQLSFTRLLLAKGAGRKTSSLFIGLSIVTGYDQGGVK